MWGTETCLAKKGEVTLDFLVLLLSYCIAGAGLSPLNQRGTGFSILPRGVCKPDIKLVLYVIVLKITPK